VCPDSPSGDDDNNDDVVTLSPNEDPSLNNNEQVNLSEPTESGSNSPDEPSPTVTLADKEGTRTDSPVSETTPEITPEPD
jgi:hypothetical protein